MHDLILQMFFKFFIKTCEKLFSVYYPRENIWAVSTKRSGDPVVILGPIVPEEVVEVQEENCDHK